MAGTPTEFDAWLSERIARGGAFTVLIVLVSISELHVDLLRSTYLHVIGDETSWEEVAALFAGAGVAWNGAAFFEARAEDGEGALVPDPEARRQLAATVARLNAERLALNEGHFFDRLGRRLQIEETTTH